MESLLNFTQGPLFAACFSIMVLGLLRIVIITYWSMRQALKRAGDKNIPYKALMQETRSWLFPFAHLWKTKPVASTASYIFHIGLLIVPVFLLDHILLWREIGLNWPALPTVVANLLTLITIIACGILLSVRLFSENPRRISGFMDYLLLALLFTIFTTGFIASRPWNPISNDASMLVHTLAGNLILLLIPFTKLAHCFLFPILRVASNIAWHFPRGAGAAVNKTLYGEEVTKI